MAQHLGARLGRGRDAEVFQWGAHEVVKLFTPGVPPDLAEQEARTARALLDAGAPAPRYGGQVRVGGRAGLVYERVDGQALLHALVRRPWRVLRLARQMAALHLTVHSRPAGPGLPSQRDALRAVIAHAPGLADNVRAAALRRLAVLPDGDRLCHGDFHPDNILLAPAGAVAVDWTTATRGRPAGDVARTLLILRYAAPPPNMGRGASLIVGGVRALFAWAYWRRYRAGSAVRAADLAPWWLPQAAARLREDLPEVERARLARFIAAMPLEQDGV